MTFNEAIQVLKWFKNGVGLNDDLNQALDMAIEALKDRPKGEWMEEEEYGGLWVCDQCGFASEYNYSFCPICGAMMIGGDDE